MMSQKKHFWDIITYGAERGFYSIFKLTTVQCVVLKELIKESQKETGKFRESPLTVAGKQTGKLRETNMKNNKNMKIKQYIARSYDVPKMDFWDIIKTGIGNSPTF